MTLPEIRALLDAFDAPAPSPACGTAVAVVGAIAASPILMVV